MQFFGQALRDQFLGEYFDLEVSLHNKTSVPLLVTLDKSLYFDCLVL
jgi:hypothetical protein